MVKSQQEKMLIELHHAVVGNGTKGLNQRVRELEDEIKSLHRELSALKQKIGWYIGSATGGTTIAFYILEKFIF